VSPSRPRVAVGPRGSVVALLALALATSALLADCSPTPTAVARAGTSSQVLAAPRPTSTAPTPTSGGSPSMRTSSPLDAASLPYAFTGAGNLAAEARRARPLVYVPEQLAGTVQVIDPRTYAVIATRRVPRSPEHVVPSADLRRLWVNSDAGNALTPIDPRTGVVGVPVPVRDPYNLYFTPDGKSALVMAERLRRVDVRDAHTMALQRSLPVPCAGLNHADFTADLTRMLVSCEFSGELAELDAAATKVVRIVDLNHIRTPGATRPADARSMGGPAAMLAAGATSMPQDVRLSPDGRSFLVADMLRNGIWVIDATTFREVRFVRTGLGAHGIYPARDARRVFVSNRGEGSVSVLDGGTLRRLATWRIPGGGSPDMGGVTADGSELWFSGRYNSCVYVIDTATGQVTHRIRVGPGPHGLLVWPQPGRFSLGHTGNMR
jgi:YVTN family beta-propeller protein